MAKLILGARANCGAIHERSNRYLSVRLGLVLLFSFFFPSSLSATLVCSGTSCSDSFIFSAVKGFSDTNSLSQFDSTLGTLDTAVLTLQSSVLQSIDIAAFNPAAATEDVTARAQISSGFYSLAWPFPDPIDILTQNLNVPFAIACLLAPDEGCSLGTNEENSFNAQSIAPDLVPLIGPGTFSVLTAIADFSTACEVFSGTSTDPATPVSGRTCVATGGASWNGTVTIDYQFSTQTVAAPEPGTIALFGVGLLGLSFMRRRRKVT